MSTYQKIGTVEAIALIVTIIINQIILNLPDVIISTTLPSKIWLTALSGLSVAIICGNRARLLS